MTLFRKTTRYYSDEYELDGLLTALGNRIQIEGSDGEEGVDGEALPFYIGAFTAINILKSYDEVRDQSVFMGFFEDSLRNAGIKMRGDFRASKS